MKKILYSDEAREKLLQGVNKIAKAVTVTLGPRGRNVALERGPEKIVIHDGVTVANNFYLTDEFEEFGASLVRFAAGEQVDRTGDGTTLVTLLIQSIFTECAHLIAAGINPMQIQYGLEKSTKMLITLLEEKAKKINTLQDKVNIATISSNNEDIGKMIGEILHKLGPDGIITVEESKSQETRIEQHEGMQFQNGWISPYQITDRNRGEATVENPYILISDRDINNVMEIAPFMQKLIGIPGKQLGVSKNIVMIAPNFSQDVLAAAILTKTAGEANILTVRAPLFGPKQKDFLKDLALLTGGVVVGDDLGTNFIEMDVAVCGHANRVTSTKDSTLIVGGKGDSDQINEHVEGLRKELEEEEGTFNREKLKERIAKLTSGVAVIKIGGNTEVEMKDKKEWTDDAIGATREAIKYGIVPGGEISLFNLAKVPSDKFADSLSEKILKNALKKPLEKILSNAGLDYTDSIISLQDKGENFGINVTTGQVQDFIKTGIIDPVSVLTNALNIAVSISIKLMTVESLIIEEKIQPSLVRNVS